jgi:hypothetical protein
MEPVNYTRLEKCGYWLFKVGATVVYTGFEVLIDGLIDHVDGVRLTSQNRGHQRVSCSSPG